MKNFAYIVSTVLAVSTCSLLTAGAQAQQTPLPKPSPSLPGVSKPNTRPEQSPAFQNMPPANRRQWDGRKLMAQGNVKEALLAFRDAYRLGNRSDQLPGQIAWAQSELGQYKEALQTYRAATREFPLPEEEDALGMALTLAKLGQYDEAIAMYRIGMRLPVHPEQLRGALAGTPYLGGYESFRSRSYSDGSEALLDIPFSVARFDSKLFEAAVRVGLARRLYGYGQDGGADLQADKALKLVPDFPPAYLYKGYVQWFRDKRPEANAYFEKAALGTGKCKEMAEIMLRRRLPIFPNHPRAQDGSVAKQPPQPSLSPR